MLEKIFTVLNKSGKFFEISGEYLKIQNLETLQLFVICGGRPESYEATSFYS